MIQPTGEYRPPIQPPSTNVYRGLFGRVIEWIRDLFRTDDEKIEAIVARALKYPEERDWGLDHIVKCTHYTTSHADSLTKFLDVVTNPITSAEKAPSLLALQLRVRLATTTIQETEVLAQLVSIVDDFKRKWGASFSLEKLGASLLQLSKPRGPLLGSFFEALRTNNPDPFFDEVGNYLFQGTSEQKELIKTALSTASFFSINEGTARQKIVKSVCECVEVAPLAFNPPRLPLTPEKLEVCLDKFIRLYELSVSLKAEDKIDEALRGRFNEFGKSKELNEILPKIRENICGDKTIVFDLFKEHVRVIEKCPREIQKVLLIGLRNELKKTRYDLQDDWLQELSSLERTVFTHSSEQTSEGIDKLLNPPSLA